MVFSSHQTGRSIESVVPDQAKNVFAEMEQQGVMPEIITCTALMSALFSVCKKRNEPDQALEVFAAIEHQVVAPMPLLTMPWLLPVANARSQSGLCSLRGDGAVRRVAHCNDMQRFD